MGKKLTGFAEAASGYPVVVIPASSAKKAVVEIVWEGNCLNPVLPEIQAEALAEIRVPSILGRYSVKYMIRREC